MHPPAYGPPQSPRLIQDENEDTKLDIPRFTRPPASTWAKKETRFTNLQWNRDVRPLTQLIP